MLYEAIALSGFLFWATILAFFILVSLPLGRDEPTGAMVFATILLIAAVLFTDFTRHLSVFWMLILVPLYVLIGVGWAIFKWRSFVLERKADARAGYAARPVLANGEVETFEQWSERLSKRPTASQNKERLTGWMALWPWSVSWLVLRFPHRMILAIYARLTTTFERMSAKLWAD